MDDATPAAAILTVDLAAVAANWRLLAARAAGAECAGVVKADAYGLGAARVAAALARAGCKSFFVAHLGEGIALRAALPRATIGVLHGVAEDETAICAAQGLAPVLNDLGQVEAWRAEARRRGVRLPALLQVDTGMNRLGLPRAELDRLAADAALLAGIELRYVMSHLACAEEPAHPLNRRQLARFASARARLPSARASLANSSGIFLGPEFHFDLVRPGAALYGINPVPGSENPMVQTVRLEGKILQLRDVDRGETVGYGAKHPVSRPARIATIGVGYADGFPRSLSNRGHADVGGKPAPIVGRVSMDLITVDVSALPADQVRPGAWATLIGPGRTPDDVAAEAGTIGYEILTALGARYARRYLGE